MYELMIDRLERSVCLALSRNSNVVDVASRLKITSDIRQSPFVEGTEGFECIVVLENNYPCGNAFEI